MCVFAGDAIEGRYIWSDVGSSRLPLWQQKQHDAVRQRQHLSTHVQHPCTYVTRPDTVLVLESSFVRLWLVHREIESMFKSVRCLFRRQVHRLNSYLAMVAFSCDQIGPGCHLKHCHNRYFLKCKSMLTVMMQHQWLHLRGNVRGIMFPFRFRRGNAVPLIYRPLWVHAGVTVNHAFCINCNLKWSVL